MEEYKFKWQMFVGMGLLAAVILTLFLPRLKVSGEKYVDFAVNVNEYAKEKDEKAAKKADANKVVTDYSKGGSKRKSSIEYYDEKLDKKTGKHPRISGLFLGKWALTVEDTLYFDGVVYEKGKKIEDSGVQNDLKMYGALLCLPAVLALALIIFMIITRKTQAKLLIAAGGVSVLCEALIYFWIPSAIWNTVKDYVKSFSLVSPDVLKIDSVGKHAMSSLFHRWSGPAWIFVIAAGVLLVAAGILFLTAFKPKMEVEDDSDFDAIFQVSPDMWNRGNDGNGTFGNAGGANGMDGNLARKVANTQGIITGVTGQYAGQTAYIKAGEEVILGRDPQYCMLVFDYPKVSRRHCGIRYDANSNTYYIIDYASNGTRLIDGTPISASEYTPVAPGTVIQLGNQTETVRLG